MSERDGGEMTLVTWYVQDTSGNIQGGHKSAEDAIRHASGSKGLTAYEHVSTHRALTPIAHFQSRRKPQ